MATIHHYTRTTDNILYPCPGCEKKNNALKTKGCYFQHNNNQIFRIQVDSRKKLHADFKSLY